MKNLKKNSRKSPHDELPRRKHWLDALRGLAILCMFVTHFARLRSLPENSSGFFDSLTELFMAIEPLTLALFLFCAGVALEAHRVAQKFFLKRIAVFLSLSSVFFIAQFGFEWPDLFFSSGPLSMIAFSLLIARSAKRSLPLLFAVSALILFLSYLGERRLFEVSGLNLGAGAVLPASLFCFAGVYFERFFHAKASKVRFIFFIFLLFSCAQAIVFFQGAPWTITTLSSFSHTEMRFWNHSTAGTLRLIAIVSIGARVSACSLSKNSALAFLGRNSLLLYVAHLLLVALLFVSGVRFASSLQMLLSVAAMTTIFFVAMRFFMRFKKNSPTLETVIK